MPLIDGTDFGVRKRIPRDFDGEWRYSMQSLPARVGRVAASATTPEAGYLFHTRKVGPQICYREARVTA
jgi:hypothetical protein